MNFKDISSTKFSPMQDFIVVKPFEKFGGKKEEEKTETGIIFELSKDKSVVNDRPVFGTVLSVGPEAKIIKPGMEIYWDVSRGHDLFFKDGEFMILTEDSILGYRNADEE